MNIPIFIDGLPEWLMNVWITLFGLVIGSFLNVVIARLPDRQKDNRTLCSA